MMLAGGAEAGIVEALVGGFAAMRALSTRNDDPAGARRGRSTSGRDGFVMRRGRRGPRARGAGARRGARGARRWPSSSATARPPTPPTSRCRRRVAIGRRPGGPAGAREGRPDAGRRRPRQRPRHVHAGGRQGRAAGHPDAPRRARRTGRRDRQQVDARAHPRRRRRASRPSPRSWRSARAASRRRINLTDPDPAGEGLDLTPQRRPQRDVRVALINSFGFGGQNAALVFRRWDGMTDDALQPVGPGTGPTPRRRRDAALAPSDDGDRRPARAHRPAGGAARPLRPDRAGGRGRRDRPHPAQAGGARAGRRPGRGRSPAPAAAAAPSRGVASRAAPRRAERRPSGHRSRRR